MPLSLDGTGSIIGISTVSVSDDLSHVGDVNTKISFPAADTISFETNGDERLRIGSDGKVGVGTDAVGSQLNVGRASGNTALTLDCYGINRSRLIFRNSVVRGTETNIDANNGDLRLVTGSGNRLNITSAGNVGVGITNPSSKLQVVGQITQTGAGAQNSHRFGSPVPFFYGQFNSSGDASINNQANADLLFATNNTERFRVTSGGVIQISQASPQVQFIDSDGTNQRTQVLQSGSALYIDLRNDANDGSLIIRGKGGDTATERLRVNTNGYLVKGTGMTCAFNVKGSNMSRNNSDNFIVAFNNDSSSGCFDSGNNFNTSTHKFVAPVSGYYHFAANIRLDGWDSGYIRMAILSTSYHSGLSYWQYPSTGHIIKGRSSGGNRPYETFATSTTMYLPANHEAYVYMTVQNETSFTVYLSESSFSGYFIG